MVTDAPNRWNAAFALALQPDGKIVAAGTSGTPNIGFVPLASQVGDFAVVRYNPNGSLDTGFASGGLAILDFDPARDDTAQGVAITPNNQIVTAGQSVGVGETPLTSRFVLARFAGFPTGPLAIVGGTWLDHDAGLVGTAFALNRTQGGATVTSVDMTGPGAWNGGVSFPCPLTQPRGLAPDRAACWTLASPVTGAYAALGNRTIGALAGGTAIDANSNGRRSRDHRPDLRRQQRAIRVEDGDPGRVVLGAG